MDNEKSEFNNITTITETIYYESAKKVLWEKSKRRVIVIFSLYMFFVIVSILILIKDGYDPSLLLPICFITIVSVLLIAYYVDIFTFRNKRKYRKEAKSGQALIYKYSFEDSCIKATWQTGTSTVFYDQISAIYYTKNTCILVADQNPQINECFVVDKNGFSSKSYNDFIEFLKGKVNNI